MRCKACRRDPCICNDTWEPVDINVGEKEPRDLARDDFAKLWGEKFGTVEECNLCFFHAITCWHMHVKAVTNTEMSQLMGLGWDEVRATNKKEPE